MPVTFLKPGEKLPDVPAPMDVAPVKPVDVPLPDGFEPDASDGKIGFFENVVCGRCGGTGHYSFNMMDGTRCYGCGGRGWKLTKRGAAAHAKFMASLKVPAKDLKLGDRVMEFIDVLSNRQGWFTVHAIDVSERGKVKVALHMSHDKYGKSHSITATYGADQLLRKAWSPADKAPKLADAYAYQAKLGKTGKLLKKYAKEAA